MYVHPEGVTVLAYVDDLFFYGPECSVDGFVRKLATLVKFSEPTFLRNTGDSLLMLGRTVTRTSKGFLLTTDPKHCIQIVAEMCDWENEIFSRRSAQVARQQLWKLKFCLLLWMLLTTVVLDVT